MAKPGDYEWEALASDHHIRLIHLAPSIAFDDPVHCSIETRSLENPGRYHTMSYAWGLTSSDGSHLTDSIVCDNKRMAVTKNLHSALQQFRADKTSWHRKHPIWIDAISINQRDPVEKAKQVLMMSDIFEKSRHLTIWLGVPADDHEAEMCARISKTYHDWEDEVLGDHYENLDRNQSKLSFQAEERDMLWRILNRDWFKRRWIIQEVLVTNTAGHMPFFRLGSFGWNWEFFIFYVERLDFHVGDPAERFLALVKRASMDSTIPATGARPWSTSILGSSSRPMSNTILETMHIFDHAQCYDARDKIYSLLSIGFGITDADAFSVDYEASVEAVYTNFARSLIESSQVYFLVYVLMAASCRQPAHRSRTALPTWVPDWRVPIYYFSDKHQLAVESGLRPWLGPRPHLRTYYAFGTGNKLFLKGWLVRLHVCASGCGSLSCIFCGLKIRVKETVSALQNSPCSHPKAVNQTHCDGCDSEIRALQSLLLQVDVVPAEKSICLLPGSEIGFVLGTDMNASGNPGGSQDDFLLHHCFPLYGEAERLSHHIPSHFSLDRLVDIPVV